MLCEHIFSPSFLPAFMFGIFTFRSWSAPVIKVLPLSQALLDSKARRDNLILVKDDKG